MAGSQKGALGSLLGQVLDDPLGLAGTDHIRPWLEALKANFPLWSFQAAAFLDLHRRAKKRQIGTVAGPKELEHAARKWSDKGALGLSEVLPSAYPLQVFINSIVRDEGLNASPPPGLTPLERTLDIRRTWLAEIRQAWAYKRKGLKAEVWDSKAQYSPEFPDFSARDAALELDAQESAPDEPYYSPYEDIGCEFVARVERWVAATSENRAQHEKAIQDLRDKVAAELGRIMVANWKGPRKEIVKALFEEGTSLLGLCWDAFKHRVSQETTAKLESQGITNRDQQHLWAVRLALPFLSEPELGALRTPTEKPDQARARVRRTTLSPKRLAIRLLEHRLQVNAYTLARKATGSGSFANSFVGWSNPVTGRVTSPPKPDKS